MSINLQTASYMRLKDVLNIYPVSKSTWWKGVKDGKYPRPHKISERIVAWHSNDIKKLIEERSFEATSETSDK